MAAPGVAIGTKEQHRRSADREQTLEAVSHTAQNKAIGPLEPGGAPRRRAGGRSWRRRQLKIPAKGVGRCSGLRPVDSRSEAFSAPRQDATKTGMPDASGKRQVCTRSDCDVYRSNTG